MKRSAYVISILVVMILFPISAYWIGNAKILELRFLLLKDRIMNYDLASVVLKSRVRLTFLNSENFKEELVTGILESSILNESPENLRLSLSPWERSGTWIANIVRFLTLKPPIRLEEDLEQIFYLQLAFEMERSGIYDKAEEQYRSLEKKLDSRTDEAAFVSLHRGFCLAVIGELENAIAKLKDTIEKYPGTHYAETAELLLSLLLQNLDIRTSFKAEGTSAEKISYLFSLGDCSETLKYLDNIRTPTRNEQYMRARCTELKGEIPEAVKKYTNIIKTGKKDRASILSNRRLMVIGKFKFKDKTVTENSLKTAEILNDKEALENFHSIGSSGQNPYITSENPKKIYKTGILANTISQYMEKASEELKQAKEILLNTFGKREEKKVQVNKPITPESSPDLSHLTPILKILLKNGRTFFVESVLLEEKKLLINSERFEITIPVENMESISLVAKEDQTVELKYDWLSIRLKSRSEKILGSKLNFSSESFRVERQDPLIQKENFPIVEIQEAKVFKTNK